MHANVKSGTEFDGVKTPNLESPISNIKYTFYDCYNIINFRLSVLDNPKQIVVIF